MAAEKRAARDYGDTMGALHAGAAADVLRSFGSAFGGHHIAIVGGLVPSLLVDAPPPGVPAHVGTSDVDLLVSLHLLDGETADYYDAIIDGFHQLGLSAASTHNRAVRWRWEGRYRGIHLRVERVSRRVDTVRGQLTYPFPVAGPTSWLCLKSDAIALRDKPKDAYDVVWLVAALGPERVAERVAASTLLAGEFGGEVRHQLGLLVDDQFGSDASVGVRAYADFLGSDGSPADARYARSAMGVFGRALRDHDVLP
ncbi:MAG TPA: hypothetical protein VGD67_23365 [Pseudonocardiaceae bacterium]